MRAVCVLVAASGACGDNDRPVQLEPIATLPSQTRELTFDREDTAVVRLGDGNVKRLVGTQWRGVVMNDARVIDFGSDNDGAVLAMSSVPRTLFRLDGNALQPVGGIVLANFVHMPMQVPSGNRYVRELDGTHRSFVLSPGSSTWAETPPMFFSRPLRAVDGTLYAGVSAGVQRFDASGRTIAVECSALGRASCTSLIVGGEDAGRIVVADPNASEVIVVDGGEVDRVPLPELVRPLRIAVGAGVTIILAARDDEHFLYAIRRDAWSIELVDGDDPASAATLLAVDHRGVVHGATTSLAKVVLP